MKIDLIAITPNAEEVIENAARTCYQSKPGEKHVIGDLILRLIKSGHHSVLEHAYATFRINGCSRSMTHQLVRHRLMAVSQESQRYVDGAKGGYYKTPWSLFTQEEESYFCDLYRSKWSINDIAKEFHINDETIRQILLRNDCDMRKRNHFKGVNEDFFERNTALSYQLLGLIFTDGCLFYDKKNNSHRITIKMKDKYYIEQIARFFDVTVNNTTEGLFSTSIHSKRIFDYLVDKYGCLPRKTHGFPIDLIEKNIPRNMLHSFFLGVFEGDGCVYWYDKNNKKGIDFTSSNVDFLQFANKVISEQCQVGVRKIKVSGGKGKNECYHLVYQSEEDIRRILYWMYSDLDFNLCLYRKLIRSFRFDNDRYLFNKIISAVEKFQKSYKTVVPMSFYNNMMDLFYYIESTKNCFDFYKTSRQKKEDRRFALNIGSSSEIVISANMREFRHIFEVRCSKHAQWEIRNASMEMLKQLYGKVPSVFEDLVEKYIS